ncbi:MAG TPA: molybdopterin-binding protein, partial [Actinomycetota bacterium]|nr:molybdopterin-binding protein [Actinomycetota bacterium]
MRLTPPRVGPFRAGAFRSRLHSERNAAWLGIALGVAFTTCFLTGLLSHLIQHPPSWFLWPTRPAGTYRVTQGIHIVTG